MIMFIFLLLSIIVILIMYIVIEKKQGQSANKLDNNNDSGSEVIQRTSMQKTLGIKKIQNSLTTSEKDELSCVLNVSTPDFSVLSESDQEIYENRLIDAVFKLNHDIKILTMVRNINMKNTIVKMEEERERISNDYLYNYSINLEESLKKEQEEKAFEKYYFIYSRAKGGYEEKLKDLKYKVNNFINSMEASGSKVKILTTNELLELSNVLIKKYDKLNMEQIEEKGAFEIMQ